jgi:polyhydroxyalkanoate synthesis regulator phasin
MKFKLKDVKPNPFRHIDRYPIHEEKIAALRESIRSTDFWDNIVARQVNGGAEIAYGHHRREALLREFGPEHEVELIVRDLHDATMLRIMAQENMAEWESSAQVEQETVRAVVEAYAEGRVELPAVAGDERHQVRYAPSFLQEQFDHGRTDAYTARTVAAFLGWTYDKVQLTLQALALIEQGAVREEDYANLGWGQARAVTREAHRTIKRVQAQGATPEVAKQAAGKVASEVRDRIASGAIGAEQARRVTDELTRPAKGTSDYLPEYDAYLLELAEELGKYLSPTRDRDRVEKLELVIPLIAEAEPYAKRELANALRGLRDRAAAYVERIESVPKVIEPGDQRALEGGAS